MSDLLEIFVPTFNRVGYLRACLLSIIKQTFTDFKVIVLDNAGSQDVAGMIKDLGDDRIRLIVNPSNIGGAANIQKAFDLASADFMMAFHDDDCMHPQLLEYQMKVFREHPQLGFISTSVNLVYDDSAMLNFSTESDLRVEYFRSSDDLINALFSGRVLGFGSVMYRTKIAKQFRIDWGRFSQICDRPYLVSLATLGPCARLINPAYNARQHRGQDSKSSSWGYLNEIEVARYYLDVSQRSELGPLRDKVIKMLVQQYAARHPRISLIVWLKALDKRELLYWTPLVKYLPYYLPRNLIVRLVRSLLPSTYQRNVQKMAGRADNKAPTFGKNSA